jgi:DNA-binding PadR family transcriptional regulator
LSTSPSFKAPQGLLRSLILAYASRFPVTGAELSADVKLKTAGQWDPSPGSVYFLINELKGKGLLTQVSSNEGGKSYITTAAGKAELGKSSGGALANLRREVSLLSLFVSAANPSEAERMEVLGWVLKADAASVKRMRKQLE